ncbi:MAG: repeat protein [Chloroflexi bacterium]|nr:repeat protein [Chloroflexota bacterium]
MTHRIFPRGILTALLALVMVALAGCGGQVAPSSWPGLTPGDGVVYLTATAKSFAINVADGSKKWEYEHKIPQTGLFGSSSVPDNMHATPALGDGLVYFGTDGGYLFALDVTTGAEKWRYLPEQTTTFIPFIKEQSAPVYAGPAVAGKRVIFAGTADKIYALDAVTGKLAWEFAAGSRVWATPLVVSDTVYISTLKHKLVALDVATGKERWTFDQAKGALSGAPVFDNGIVYVGSFDNHLYAVDAASGEKRWAFNASNWVWEGPAVVSGTLYFGDVGGNVYALDAATQQRLWVTELNKLPVPGGPVRATPLYADGTLYVGTANGALYALDASTGKERSTWTTFKVPNAQFLTTPVLQGGLLLVAPLGTPTQLYGLNPDNGQTQWQFPTPTSK